MEEKLGKTMKNLFQVLRLGILPSTMETQIENKAESKMETV